MGLVQVLATAILVEIVWVSYQIYRITFRILISISNSTEDKTNPILSFATTPFKTFMETINLEIKYKYINKIPKDKIAKQESLISTSNSHLF